MDNESSNQDQISKHSRLSDLTGLMPLSSILTFGVIGLFIFWFFNLDLFRFYASALFGFYAITNHMWIAVILLGVFQTLLMIPLRIRRLQKKTQIEELEESVAGFDEVNVKKATMKRNFSLGNRAFLFYILDFTIQLTTFLTIGRLFLTDFYRYKLNPDMLYGFIPYPDYPIHATIFKLPYVYFTKVLPLEGTIFYVAWFGVFAVLVVILLLSRLVRRIVANRMNESRPPIVFNRYTIGYIFVFIFLSWIIVRHIPLGLGIGIFRGDVSRQNTTLNTVTAVATFLTMLWLGVTRIWREEKDAELKGFSQELIDAKSKKMFGDALKSSMIVAAGAYFITNRIPSAFELSVFTLELISLLSPFTLDRAILKLQGKVQNTQTVSLAMSDSKEETISENTDPEKNSALDV